MEQRTVSQAAGRTIKTISGTLALLRELERVEGRKVLIDSLPCSGQSKEWGQGEEGGGNQKRAEPGVALGKLLNLPGVPVSACIK